MRGYFEKPTAAERLAEYMQSDELAEDIGVLKNEYHCSGQAVPSEAQLRSEATMQKQKWLEQLEICEVEGHQFTETADGENGTSDLDCNRCGMTFHCQW